MSTLVHQLSVLPCSSLPIPHAARKKIYRATWEEIDLDAGVWTLPAERMKGRRVHRVPLAPKAVKTLRDLALFLGRGTAFGWVFPSLRSKGRPISENTVNMALRLLGYGPDVMIAHGFRAIFSSIANASGLWDSDLIEAQLAHAEKNKVRAAYNRTDFLERRQEMMAWYVKEIDPD